MTKPQTLEDLLRLWAELEPEPALLAIHCDENEGETQVRVQESLWNRGWDWSLQVGPGGYFIACVHPDESTEHRRGSHTPAAALLTAYLQALEAHAP